MSGKRQIFMKKDYALKIYFTEKVIYMQPFIFLQYLFEAIELKLKVPEKTNGEKDEV